MQSVLLLLKMQRQSDVEEIAQVHALFGLQAINTIIIALTDFVIPARN